MSKLICLIFVSIICVGIVAQTNYPGSAIIGRGYNIFGEYANSKSIMQYPLFDFSKIKKKTSFEKEVPKVVLIENISDHVVETIEGESMTQYINSLANGVGLSGGAFFFKASIDKQFSSTSTNTTNSFYYTYMDVNTKWRVSLDTRNKDTLAFYLDPQFKLDLASLSPKELFEVYGTHYIASAYIGGRIDYSATANTSSISNTNSIKTAITAKCYSISGSAEFGEDDQELFTTASVKDKLSVIGGNSEFANNINNHEQYLRWAEGIKGAPVLCGFNDKSLRPIWELTTDSKRKKELETYFLKTVIPNHPLPKQFVNDAVLDNNQITQKFTINFDGFVIHQDCDNYALTGDESGDFEYNIAVYIDDVFQERFKTQSGYVNKVWSGQVLTIDKQLDVSIDLAKRSTIKVVAKLQESDALETELLGNKTIVHEFPYSESDLSNTELEGYKYWKKEFYKASDCNATMYYQVVKIFDETAMEFGNRGWKEFEKGNYDQCLFYSGEALKKDNSLFYVHYNIALVYLIQDNPMAFEKYKVITELCGEKETVEAALKDILDYERVNGELERAEPVKLLLRTRKN